jgi:hypothetical protein
MDEQKFQTEEFQFNGDMLMAKIKELLHAGNIRRLIIKNEEGRILIDIPLTLGVVGCVAGSPIGRSGRNCGFGDSWHHCGGESRRAARPIRY